MLVREAAPLAKARAHRSSVCHPLITTVKIQDYLVLFGGALFMLFGLSLEKFHEARAELCQAVGGVSDGTVSRGERGPRGTLRALGPTPARGTATTRGETARATTRADATRRTATCQCARVRG